MPAVDQGWSKRVEEGGRKTPPPPTKPTKLTRKPKKG